MVYVLVVFGTRPLFGWICIPRIPRMNCLIAFNRVQRTEHLRSRSRRRKTLIAINRIQSIKWFIKCL